MIKAENICKNYGSLPVLQNLNLYVPSGCFCIITGPSGTGKSTLLNVLSGLDSFDSGRLILAGRDARDIGGAEGYKIRREHIGFVFQSYNLISSMTALENVMLPLKYKKVKYFMRRSMALQALEKMGLRNKIYNLPHEMSGGQQQRVAVARALVCSPDILFCDEPTGNLDRDSASLVIKGILELKKKGSAIVMITHDKSLIKYADISYSLKNGDLV